MIRFSLLLLLFATVSFKIAFAQQSALRTSIDSAWQYRKIDFVKSNNFASQALAIAPKGSTEQAQALFILGYTSGLLGNPDLSLAYYLKGADALEALHDTSRLVALYNELTLLYHRQGLFDQSRNLITKTLSYAAAIGDIDQLAEAYNARGLMHLDYYEKVPGYTSPVHKQLDSALTDFRQAYFHYNSIDSKLGMSYCLDYLATTMMHLGRKEDALHYLLAGRDMRSNLEDKMGTAISINNIGEFYLAEKNPKESLKWFRSARDSASAIHFKDLVAHTWRMESDALHLLGDNAAALLALKEYQKLREEMSNEKKEKVVHELQTKYETEKKEQANKLLTQKNQVQALQVSRSKIIIASLALAILLAGGLTWLLYNRYRLRQNAALQQELMHQQQMRIAAVLEAEESERQRLARELHDGIGQMLAATRRSLQKNVYVSALEGKETPLPHSQDPLQLLDESIREVRQLSHSMIPPSLRNKTLIEALEELAERTRQASDLNVHTDWTHASNIPEDKSHTLMIYRSVQEIINNSLKHAEAQTLTMEMVMHESEINLLIYDDGKGFDLEAMHKGSKGLGLKNISSRIAFIGGTLHIETKPGAGVTYIIDLPIKQNSL